MSAIRKRVLTVSYLLAFVVTTLAFGWIAKSERQKRLDYEAVTIERALVQMAESSAAIKKALDGITADTAAEERLRRSYEIKLNCLAATVKMQDLPANLDYTAGFFRFFNIASDYAESIARDYDGDGIYVLKSYASKIEALLAALLSGQARSDYYETLTEELARYPYLYYNGKYTDSAAPRGFALLYNSEKITEREAYEKAKALLGKNAALTLVKNSGFPPVYTYVCNNASVEISVMGGYPIRLLLDLPAKEAKYDENICVCVAEEYLKTVGLEDLARVKVWWVDNVCFVEFARRILDGQNVGLSELERVTVGVSASAARVCYYDAYNYYRYRGDMAAK